MRLHCWQKQSGKRRWRSSTTRHGGCSKPRRGRRWSRSSSASAARIQLIQTPMVLAMAQATLAHAGTGAPSERAVPSGHARHGRRPARRCAAGIRGDRGRGAQLQTSRGAAGTRTRAVADREAEAQRQQAVDLLAQAEVARTRCTIGMRPKSLCIGRRSWTPTGWKPWTGVWPTSGSSETWRRSISKRWPTGMLANGTGAIAGFQQVAKTDPNFGPEPAAAQAAMLERSQQAKQEAKRLADPLVRAAGFAETHYHRPGCAQRGAA